VMNDANGYKAVDYAKLTPVLAQAIKEQQKEIDDLKKDVDELKKSLQALMQQAPADKK
jgi:hypothetical protein